jgi:hypothetical protein
MKDIELVVEICLHKAKFSGFSKNERVYDDLLIGQPGVKVRTSRRAGVNSQRLYGCRCPQPSGRKMRKNQRRFLCLGISIFGVLTFSPALLGQASPASGATVPVFTDWSNHHLVFSKPSAAEQAKRVERDPRYWQQQLRHSPARLREAETRGAFASRMRHRSNGGISQDWSVNLGSGATVGANNFPAKIGFLPTNATCAGGPTQADIVVYGTGLAG